MTVVLSVTDGPHAGESIDVLERNVVLGRDAFPEDRHMSFRHAQLSRDTDGGLVIRDLDSRNGTYVNGQRLKSVRNLRDGDTIFLGKTTLQLDVYQYDTESFEHVRVPPSSGNVDFGNVRATDGAVVAGRVAGGIRSYRQTRYERDTISGSRGFARLVIGLGLLLFIVGFGLFAYPIVMAISEGFSGQLAPGQPPTVEFVPWLPVGFGLAAVGAALMQIGIFLKR
jgi:hypothetical protein